MNCVTSSNYGRPREVGGPELGGVDDVGGPELGGVEDVGGDVEVGAVGAVFDGDVVVVVVAVVAVDAVVDEATVVGESGPGATVDGVGAMEVVVAGTSGAGSSVGTTPRLPRGP